jgi:hypothetical protein
MKEQKFSSTRDLIDLVEQSYTNPKLHPEWRGPYIPPRKKKEKEWSKSEEFKKKNGYSLTTSKLMKKYSVETIEEYRLVRRENKAKFKKLSQKAPKIVTTATPAKKKK